MVRLIVSDLDGTLLRDDHTLSEYTKAVIHRVSEQGVDFMLATGRIFGGARQYAKELKLNTPILACNGALIKEAAGKLLYGKPLLDETLGEIFQLLTDNHYYFHCYGEESFYTREFGNSLTAFYSFNTGLPEEERFPMVEIDPIELIGKDTIYKVLARCEGEEERKVLYSSLSEIAGASVTVSWHNTFDICADGVSKASAIERYAKKNGIRQSEILCFGDNYNDMDMLQYAGLGIAVENGVKELKEAADYVTANNNADGVARAIERFVLDGQSFSS
ncbi:MAG: Cof-type HAD-IIB family hydrolase [Eubacteriales bacterium]|nr:Cof-type HAD-IIB family hydrolase [Eubacteriales bacterium]